MGLLAFWRDLRRTMPPVEVSYSFNPTLLSVQRKLLDLDRTIRTLTS
jgi:hypothetical protein